MKIAICGSMAFAKEMLEVRSRLEKMGHRVVVPQNTEKFASGERRNEDKWEKIEIDPIRVYHEEIKNGDAILVLNYDKSDIKNYIGGNSFLEIHSAYLLDKKIFLLNSVPEMLYTDEIKVMRPVVLNGKLEEIN